MLTSLGYRNEGERIGSGYVNACLTKPVKQSRFFNCLAKVMGSAPRREPQQQAIAAPRKSTGPNRAPSRERQERLRILLAEDNIVNQKLALMQLHNLGYAADAVADGLEAVKALELIPYDIVLMDCQMPVMDGYEATAEIRRRERGARRATIIAMTAHALSGDREKCLSAGMDDYISKPVREEDLVLVLGRWVEQAAAHADDDLQEGRAPEHDADMISALKALTRGGGNDLLSEMVDLFIKDAAERLDALRSALVNEDGKSFYIAAHALKGSCGNLGAKRMAALCDYLEEQGRAGRVRGLAPLVATLEEEFANVRRALEYEKQKSITG
jgi:CheY-like chemotaxis protein/HPt (histidine-containing phosphotransfer) domain-containing protein